MRVCSATLGNYKLSRACTHVIPHRARRVSHEMLTTVMSSVKDPVLVLPPPPPAPSTTSNTVSRKELGVYPLKTNERLEKVEMAI